MGLSAHSSSQETSPYAIDIDGLNFSWASGAQVLNDCCLQVPRGKLWMLLGANGSGKSTLLQLMSGLLPPASEGRMVLDQPVGYVFQNPDRQLVMPTVGADVAFGLAGEALSQAEMQWRVRKALSVVGMEGFVRRPVYALSGGQKHRVAIAGALARNSQLLLLDEPTALLDPESQRDLVEQVRHLVDEQGISALWITHRLEELEWADTAAVLADGRIVDQGNPRDIAGRLKQLTHR